MEYWITRDINNDSFAHHGIKGQKHGVRRYQYEDGSLTPEGKERYASDSVPRSRKRTTDLSGSTGVIQKTQSINGPAWVITKQTKVEEENQNSGNFSPIPSDDEYEKKKKELDEKDWIDVYDAEVKGELHLKREEFVSYIKELVDKGMNPKMHEITTASASSDPEVAAEMREKNSLVRYWNEQVEKVLADDKKPQLTKTVSVSQAKPIDTELRAKLAKEILANRKKQSVSKAVTR